MEDLAPPVDLSPDNFISIQSDDILPAKRLLPYMQGCDDLAKMLLNDATPGCTLNLGRTCLNSGHDAIAYFKIPRGVVKLNDGRTGSSGCSFVGLHLYVVLHNGGPARPRVEGRFDRLIGAKYAVQRAWASEMRDPSASERNRLEFGVDLDEPEAFLLSDLVLTAVGHWGQSHGIEHGFDPDGPFVLVESLQFCSANHMKHEKRKLSDSTIVSMRFKLGDNNAHGGSNHGPGEARGEDRAA